MGQVRLLRKLWRERFAKITAKVKSTARDRGDAATDTQGATAGTGAAPDDEISVRDLEIASVDMFQVR